VIEDYVSCINLSYSGNYLAIGTHLGKVMLYDIIKGINKNLYIETE